MGTHIQIAPDATYIKAQYTLSSAHLTDNCVIYHELYSLETNAEKNQILNIQQIIILKKYIILHGYKFHIQKTLFKQH